MPASSRAQPGEALRQRERDRRGERRIALDTGERERRGGRDAALERRLASSEPLKAEGAGDQAVDHILRRHLAGIGLMLELQTI